VRAIASSVVRIGILDKTGTENLYSGVLVNSKGERYVVTAGHSLRDLNNQLPEGKLFCSDTHNITGLTSSGEVVHPSEITVDSFTSSMLADDSAPDLSLLHLADVDPRLASVAVRVEPIKPNEPLYFINWQNTNDGQNRLPDASQPVIIGGTAFASTGKNDVLAFTWKAFGEQGQETNLNPVSSGGLVVDAKGEMVGITTGACGDNVHQCQQIEKDYGIRLVNQDGSPRWDSGLVNTHGDPLSVSVIEPVNAQILSTLVDRLNAKPDPCNPVKIGG
jgi:hypothetical protein